jgi:hypothetical protein
MHFGQNLMLSFFSAEGGGLAGVVLLHRIVCT